MTINGAINTLAGFQIAALAVAGVRLIMADGAYLNALARAGIRVPRPGDKDVVFATASDLRRQWRQRYELMFWVQPDADLETARQLVVRRLKMVGWVMAGWLAFMCGLLILMLFTGPLD